MMELGFIAAPARAVKSWQEIIPSDDSGYGDNQANILLFHAVKEEKTAKMMKRTTDIIVTVAAVV
jgi:hypothetical protein